MRLPPEDRDYLTRSGIAFREYEDGSGMLNVELINFPLPEGLNAAQANILFRLAASYPDTPPDMWWAIPHLTSLRAGTIAATELIENHGDRAWQRWSRHLNPGAWRSGVDGLENYVRLLRTELSSAAA